MAGSYLTSALYPLPSFSFHAFKISLQSLLISPRRLAAALGLDGTAEGGGKLGEPGFLFELLGRGSRVLVFLLSLAVSLRGRRELQLPLLLFLVLLGSSLVGSAPLLRHLAWAAGLGLFTLAGLGTRLLAGFAFTLGLAGLRLSL